MGAEDGIFMKYSTAGALTWLVQFSSLYPE
jgi:hypothetical protein